MDNRSAPSHASEALFETRDVLWMAGSLASGAVALLLPIPIRVQVIEALCFVAAALAVGLAVRRSQTEIELRWSWRLFALAMALQASSHLLRWRWESSSAPFPPFPTVADGLQVSVLVITLCAYIVWPAEQQSPGRRLRSLLDALIFMGSLVFLFWQLGLRESLRLTGPSPLAQMTFLGAFFLAILLFAYWVYLVLPAGAFPRGPLAWLGLLSFGGALVNLGGLMTGLAGTYFPGHWVDVALVPVLGFAVPALWSKGPGRVAVARVHEARDPFLTFLPYLPLFLVFCLVAWQLLLQRAALDWQAMAIGSPVMLLLVLRQFLMLRDAEALAQGLETTVRARTQSLEAAQQLLLRTERMNSLAVLGAGLAHDLKNLLGIVSNYALLMRQDADDGKVLDPGDLEAIHEAAKQAGSLAHQLMAYGHEDEVPPEPVLFDLGDRMRALLSLLRAALPLGIALEMTPPKEPTPFLGDPGQFDQMLANLVLNARDAISERGHITVACGPLEQKGEKRQFQLEVRDTGCGMSAGTMAKLFEPFFTTKPAGKGTGLGLASIRAYLDRVGGRIEAESQEGQGTVFRVHLPLAS